MSGPATRAGPGRLKLCCLDPQLLVCSTAELRLSGYYFLSWRHILLILSLSWLPLIFFLPTFPQTGNLDNAAPSLALPCPACLPFVEYLSHTSLESHLHGLHTATCEGHVAFAHLTFCCLWQRWSCLLVFTAILSFCAISGCSSTTPFGEDPRVNIDIKMKIDPAFQGSGGSPDSPADFGDSHSPRGHEGGDLPELALSHDVTPDSILHLQASILSPAKRKSYQLPREAILHVK